MRDYITISISSIIKESQTTEPGYCNKKYIVYYNVEEDKQKIHINTYYNKKENVIELCKHYDRELCDTIEEYEKLNLHYIESQAYGSWMDGAR